MGFERRLLALGFPQAGTFNGSTAVQATTLASWLEDRVIRLLAMEARAPLRAGELDALTRYLQELEAPEAVMADLQASRYPPVCSWLLLTALQFACEDLDEDGGSQPSLQGLAAAHGVAFNARDRAGTLQAALQAARQKKGAAKASPAPAAAGALPSKAEFPLGFETGDEALDAAARGLRMLYVAELRALQTHFNDVVATAQEFTANPKTDSKLGKVGR